MGGKLFLSRSSQDRAAALPLIEALRTKGFDLLTQDHDILTGDDFKAFMDHALRESNVTVALISTAYLGSEWCRREARAADGVSGHRLIPLVIEEGCQPNGLLASLVYCDVTSLLQLGADKVADLVHEIIAFGKPIGEAPPARAYLRHSTFISNVSFDDDAVFVGRDAELKELEDAFWRGGGAVAITQAAAVHGLGGVGKSALALAYAARNRHRYRGVWRVRAEELTTLVDDLAALSAQLLPQVGVEADEAVAARAGLQEIAHTPGRPFLIVFDNVEDPRDIRDWRPTAGAHLLITSRWRDWDGAGARAVTLKTLTAEAATDLLLRLSGRQDREGLGDLAEKLGRLPLALTHAAAVLRRAKTLSFADYAADLLHRLETLPKGAGDYPAAVRAALESNLAMLSRDDVDAPQLLALAAYCAPDAIPLELWDAEPALAVLPNSMRQSPRLAEALGALEAWSLATLDVNQRTLSVHRLAQMVMQAIVEEAGRGEAVRCAVVRAFNAIYPAVEFSTRMTCARLSVHAEAVLAHLPKETALQDAGRLANQVGSYRQDRAEFDLAELMFRRALAIMETCFGSDSLEVGPALNNLALLLKVTKRLSEAEPMFRRALAITEKRLGPEDPDVATGLNNLASLLRANKHLAEAEPMYRRALAIDEKRLGPDHQNVATDLNNLAGLLWATNRLAEAEPMYRRALAIDEKSLAPDHPSVATDLNNLAGLLRATNRLAEAEPMYRRALAINERSLPAGHPSIERSRRALETLMRAKDVGAPGRLRVHKSVRREGQQPQNGARSSLLWLMWLIVGFAIISVALVAIW